MLTHPGAHRPSTDRHMHDNSIAAAYNNSSELMACSLPPSHGVAVLGQPVSAGVFTHASFSRSGICLPASSSACSAPRLLVCGVCPLSTPAAAMRFLDVLFNAELLYGASLNPLWLLFLERTR